MSNDLIRKGIDALQAAGVRSTADVTPAGKLAAMSGLDVSPHNLKTFRSSAKSLRDGLVRARESLEKEIKAKTARIEKEYSELGWIEGDRPGTRIDQLGADRRRSMKNKAIAQMTRTVRGTMNEKVAEAHRVLKEHKDKLPFFEEAYHSPLLLLNRSTLLSNDRDTAQGILNGAGVHTINTAAAEAVRTNNRALAAAVTSAIDGLPKEQRQLLKFSREEIAASVVADEFLAAYEQLVMSKYLLTMSCDLVAEVEAGKVDHDQKIRTGLIKRDLAAQLGKTEESLDDEGGQVDGNN